MLYLGDTPFRDTGIDQISGTKFLALISVQHANH